MSANNDHHQSDSDATNYGATPSDPTATRYTDDAHGTRYSGTAADPHATAYTPTPSALDHVAAGRLPRSFGGYELLAELSHGGNP